MAVTWDDSLRESKDKNEKKENQGLIRSLARDILYHLTTDDVFCLENLDFSLVTIMAAVVMKDENLETFSLIWLDANNSIDEKRRDMERQLRCVINHLRKFAYGLECLQYIKQRSTDDRLMLIVSDEFGRELVPQIHELKQVSSIYVYCMNQSSNDQWTHEFPKVRLEKIICFATNKAILLRFCSFNS